MMTMMMMPAGKVLRTWGVADALGLPLNARMHIVDLACCSILSTLCEPVSGAGVAWRGRRVVGALRVQHSGCSCLTCIALPCVVRAALSGLAS